ncbi:MAG: translocation/assembly module TamB domain-containing protein [Puniceicoccales bacterium]
MKRIFRVLGLLLVIAFLLLLVGVATLDQSTPWLLRPALNHFGATVEKIETKAGHYTLTNLRWSDLDAGMSVDAEKIVLPTPWRVITRKWFGGKGLAQVEANAVTLTQRATAGEGPEEESDDAEVDLAALVRQGLDYWGLAFDWIDRVAFSTLVYRDGDGEVARVESLTLDARILAVTGVTAAESPEDVVAVHVTREDTDALVALVEVPNRETTLHLILSAADELLAEGEVILPGVANRLTYQASWNTQGVIPHTAVAKAANFTIPAELLEVPGYAEPAINLDANWDGKAASIRLVATADPTEDRFPELDIELIANGNHETVTVEKFIAKAWSSDLHLSAPITVQLNDLESIPDAEFTADIDLDAVPVDAAKGRLKGSVVADHRSGSLPLITVKFSGDSLGYDGVTLEALELHAVADLPMVSVKQLDAETGDGSTFSLAAEVDTEREEILSANFEASLKGGLLETVKPFVGEVPVAFESGELKVSASGPWMTPQHEGALMLTGFKPEKLVPGTVAINWKGDYLDFSELTVDAKSEAGEVNLVASAALGGADRMASLTKLRIAITDEPELNLEERATILLQESGAISVTGFDIISTAGGEMRLSASADYPSRGKLNLAARDISGEWLSPLLEEPLPFQLEADVLNIAAEWDEGPLTADIGLDILVTPPDQDDVKVHLEANADGENVRLHIVEVIQRNVKLLNAEGGLPLIIEPASETPLVFTADTPVDFKLHAAPDDSEVWNSLEEQLGFDFIRPVIDFTVAGSLGEPEGKLHVAFDAFELMDTEDNKKLPRIAQADVQASFSPARIQLSQFGVDIAGQRFTAKGELPMGRPAWQALVEDQTIPAWDNASGEVNFTDVPLTAFKDWLPPMIRDDGDISLRASLSPGERIRGTFEVNEVRTRPVAQLGAVNDITARFALEDRVMRVETASAVVGGATVALSGDVRIGDDWKPLMNLSVKGDNVPVVRSPGIILRASPDIQIVSDEQHVTTVRGEVLLNESFFTMDLTSLGQGGGGGGVEDTAPAKPPFFSIEDEPLASWCLQLKITGDRFLRVNVPAFSGVVSSNFQLRGSLRDPFMFGQATLESGVVLFPFATLRMEHGVVSISQNDPATVRLDVLASGRAYGYDIDMRVSGTQAQPIITFNSTPSLEQSDILLMVTSGQIPDHARSTQSKLSGIGMYIGNSFLAQLGLIDPLDDTLEVNVGEDVTVSGKDTVNVRYRINDDWTAVGAYDKYDAYYLDLEWTVYED